MPTYNSSYLVSTLGYSGRVPFTSTAVGYFFPLIDTATITISNAVTGDTTDWNAPSDIKFPILFQFTATAACRVRRRRVHSSVNVYRDTASMFTRLTGSCGYSNVAAATDAIRHATLPSANIAAGTTSLAARAFDAINTGSYGGLVPSGITFPIIVNSLRDCWLQIIARDGAGTATSGELVFTCVSDDNIVGY